jgi:hypothetical protein
VRAADLGHEPDALVAVQQRDETVPLPSHERMCTLTVINRGSAWFGYRIRSLARSLACSCSATHADATLFSFLAANAARTRLSTA